jgi:hydroxyacylglutathione hydrolase
MIQIEKLQLGPLAANCYIIWNQQTAADQNGLRPCLLIDPGAEPETILDCLTARQLLPELIIATHCHGDHIGAIDPLLQAFPQALFAAGTQEAQWPADPVLNLSYGFGLPLRAHNPDRLIKDGEVINVAGMEMQALAVPGHSPGSIVLYCQEAQAAFTGDTLFALNIGRGDLPGGDEALLVKSIREKLFVLPPETVVWPGHANRSRIGTEMKANPFCGLETQESF